MVFRLALARRDDGKAEDSNNNQHGRSASTTATSAGGVPGDVEDDSGACCCCCYPGWFRQGRHSAKVSPERRSDQRDAIDLDGLYRMRLVDNLGDSLNGSLAAKPGGGLGGNFDGNKCSLFGGNVVGGGHPYDAPLSLDSIDSTSENHLPTPHVPPQKPVLARPSNSPPSAPTSTARNPSAQHPLAPLDLESLAQRNDSASSSRTSANTSANTSSSTMSLHNPSGSASGQASGVTSGYYSSVASPGTDVSGTSRAETNDIVRNGEATASNDSSADTDVCASTRAVGTEDDGVDGSSYDDQVQRQRFVEEAGQPQRTQRDQRDQRDQRREFGVVRRVDISPPPKRQSATRRPVAAPTRPGRGVRVLNRPRATTPGSLGSSARASSLSSLTNGSLSSSLGNSTASLFADSLPGFENPREALTKGLQQLDSMEWETTMQALQTLVRLVRHHPSVVLGQLHTCCESLARQVRNLRSQVARAACQAASHLFHSLKRGMDAEAEDLSTALFNRTADTNKFLRADANMALDAMTDNITPAKAVSAIVHKGCRHQNAVVRTAGARLLARLVEKLGVERMMSQSRETRDLMLLTSARLLMEGSLETRSYTKTLLKNLAQDHRLSSILVEIVPSNVMRSIDKTLKSCILRK